MHPQKQYGYNRQHFVNNQVFSVTPRNRDQTMFLLLVAAASIYFITGDRNDGFLCWAPSSFRHFRFRDLQPKRDRGAPQDLHVLRKVIRNGVTREDQQRNGVERCDDGDRRVARSADGVILQSDDFSVNESILTGESFRCFQIESEPDNNKGVPGTFVSGGSAICRITAIGNQTNLRKIAALFHPLKEKTPTAADQQLREEDGPRGCTGFPGGMGINYFQSGNVFDSLQKALTLAMSILPERDTRGLYNVYGAGSLAADEDGRDCETNQNRGNPGQRIGDLRG